MASGFVTKEWKQRISEFATRRLLSIVSQSSGNMTVDVSRAEGLVSQVGDAFSPENMNGLEQRIANAFANVDADVTAAKKSASDGKTLIAAAITEKKVAASASDTFAVLAQKIGQIVLGSGNATAADVLYGKTFTNDDGVQYTGTMPNNGTFAYSGVNSVKNSGPGYYAGIIVDTVPSYVQGVIDADARINAGSVNYQSGYSAGRASLKKASYTYIGKTVNGKFSHDTGKNLVCATITNTANLWFYAYGSANTNYYVSGKIAISVSNSVLTVDFGSSFTSWSSSNGNEHDTTVQIDYYYWE